MANIPQAYNPQNHEPSGSFDPIPAGWYEATIIESEVKDTKNGQNKYLELRIQLSESRHPEHGSRLLFERLNLWNSNQQAVDIANRSLAALCRAIGQVSEWTDSEVLHHKAFAVKVKIRPASGDYDASNDVTGYDTVAKRFGGGQQQAAGSAPSSPPWKR